MQFAAHTVSLEPGVLDPHIRRCTAGGIGHNLYALGHCCAHLAGELVVRIDHRVTQTIEGKQTQLGATVGVHAAVIIKVIVGQIGIDCCCKLHTGYPTLHQRMGGHFHADGKDALR